MILTLSWLKDHLKTTAPINQIIEKLTDIGLEVEGVSGGPGENSLFKIAKIIKSEKHPNADKLKLCEVSIGGEEQIKVVCGAPNAKDGLLTIYAPPESVIPKNNMKLEVTKIRGVTSYGMLCSESELKISDESQGIISLSNKYNNMIGKSYFSSKKENTIELSVTPNRPDCLGIRGIARDLAAAGIGKLKNLKDVPNKTTANIKQALFVGSSADLHKMLKNKNKDVQSEEDKDFKGKDITPKDTDVSDK